MLMAQGVLAYSVHPGGTPTELPAKLPQELHCKFIVFPRRVDPDMGQSGCQMRRS